MVQNSSPITVARLRAGLSRYALAKKSGVSLEALDAIERGRTAAPSEDTVALLARVLGVPAKGLWLEQRAWREAQDDSDVLAELSPAGRLVLRFAPERVAGGFVSFTDWRVAVEPSRARFASLLGVQRMTVDRYERGLRVRGFPDTLAGALLRRLRVSPEYLAAVASLPANSEVAWRPSTPSTPSMPSAAPNLEVVDEDEQPGGDF